jgi:hypothetical protein
MKYNIKQSQHSKTTNLAGGEAFKESSKIALVSLLLTSFVKDQFYRSESEGLEQLKKLMAEIPDKQFIAKAAIFARNEYGMRSISHVVAGELFRKNKNENPVSDMPWVKNFIDQVIRRPDDATEIRAYYEANVMEKALPAQLKKGLALAMTKFNEYQLAKYKGQGKHFKLVDIVNTTHPKANKAITKLVKDTLASPETWEVKLTQVGQNAESYEEKEELKAEAWRQLISENKLGYFALLRNLRNILNQAPDMVDEACKQLVNREAIHKSLVLPFRFITAVNEVKQITSVTSTQVRKVTSALNKAIDIALENVPYFEGRTLVVLDESGSMGDCENPKSPFSIGSLFAAMLMKVNDADYIGFSTNAEYRNFNLDNTIMGIVNEINQTRINGGTNLPEVFRVMDAKYDRVIILSDMQTWIGEHTANDPFKMYCKEFNITPYVYSYDLQGYGTIQFPEKKVCNLSGFSDKVFDLMKIVETDKQALIHKIEEIEL